METGCAGLAFAADPERIPGGNETVIHGFELAGAPPDLQGPLILRAYVRGDVMGPQWHRETIIHNTLAEQGLPVPRVRFVADATAVGVPFVLMERAPGRVMGSDVFATGRLLMKLPRLIADMPRALAENHLRLHAVDPGPLRERLAAQAMPDELNSLSGRMDWIRALAEANAHPSLLPALGVLERRLPAPDGPEVICHGDFHPLNILCRDGRTTGIIDWSGAVFAEPAFDVAGTWTLMSLTRLQMPAALQPLARGAMRRIATTYVRHYTRTRPLNPARIEFYATLRALFELAFYTAHLPGRTEIDGGAGGWDYAQLRARVEAATGLTIAHPAAP